MIVFGSTAGRSVASVSGCVNRSRACVEIEGRRRVRPVRAVTPAFGQRQQLSSSSESIVSHFAAGTAVGSGRALATPGLSVRRDTNIERPGVKTFDPLTRRPSLGRGEPLQFRPLGVGQPPERVEPEIGVDPEGPPGPA